jgi:hypothetical protein
MGLSRLRCWHPAIGSRLALALATMVAQDDRLLNDLVFRCFSTLVDLDEDRGGFVASQLVRYLDRFGLSKGSIKRYIHASDSQSTKSTEPAA